MSKIIYSFLFLLLSNFLSAQQNNVEMADAMRSNGKIYVIVACILVIFLVFILYLIRIDKKITRLEKEINSK